MDAGVHEARRAKLDRARKVCEAEGKRVDEGEGENERAVAGEGQKESSMEWGWGRTRETGSVSRRGCVSDAR